MESMSLQQIDHFELVVSDIEKALDFYRLLGVKTSQTTSPQGRERWFLDVGDSQQINVVTPKDVEALGRKATAGGGHFCMVWQGAPEAFIEQLSRHGLVPRRGPGRGFGALGEGTSLFINDPDSNSVEIIVYP
jgi:catechol 2,3-dioxygenase-like lactoylglutathione lyase family enzyme